jgi:hypothetical protein
MTGIASGRVAGFCGVGSQVFPVARTGIGGGNFFCFGPDLGMLAFDCYKTKRKYR